MNNEKERIREYLPQYLASKGVIDLRNNFSCILGTHEDKKPSMGYKASDNTIKCFSCGFQGDIFDLIGHEYSLTEFKDQFNKAKEITGIIDSNPPSKKPIINKKPSKEYTNQVDYFNECKARIKETDYLINRGLTDEIIAKYNIGYDPNYKTYDFVKKVNTTWQAIIIPTSDYSYIARNINSNDQANKVRRYGNVNPLNRELLKSDKPIFIVEGELDAMSIDQLGYNAISLGGMNNKNAFFKELEALEDKSNLKPLILALDNDGKTEEATKTLADKLKSLNIDYIEARPYLQYKDGNEALKNDLKAFKEQLQIAIDESNSIHSQEAESEKEKYLKNSVFNHIDAFLDTMNDSLNTAFIPTGFAQLDNTLDGGLYEGLYVLGAMSSLGKTTLALQVADQIAKNGNDVIIFSLEMARYELMAKSISRYTAINNLALNGSIDLAKTTRGITTQSRYKDYNENELELIVNSIQSYREISKHLFIHEGLGNIGANEIRQIIEKHIKITGNKPVVIIDYLQILAPYDYKFSDKQNTDKVVLELKRISRDNKLPIIAISSFNRDNYTKEVSMAAFKESGAIEYGSDVLIALQFKGQGETNFNLDEAKQRQPRDIELKILKNRNGETGKKINLEYYPKFNYFDETF